MESEFLHYSFRAETLCIGERIKKGTFRPTVITIPYSSITGALKAHFGGKEIHAVGHITSYETKDYLTYSPRDRIIGVSKLPVSIEFLVNVAGNVYVIRNNETQNFPNKIELMMGALRTKGLGASVLKRKGLIRIEEEKHLEYGELNTRIPLEHLNKFLVKPIKPRYGYLLKPLSLSKAIYVKSLFEGSEVYAPNFLIKRG